MQGINKLYAYQFYGDRDQRTRESLRVVVDLVGTNVVLRSERSVFSSASSGALLAHDVQRAIDTDGLLVSTLTQTRGEFVTALRVLSELVGCDPAAAGKIDPGERPVGYSTGIMQIMDQRGELVAVMRSTRLAVEREIATAFYVGFHAGQGQRGGRR